MTEPITLDVRQLSACSRLSPGVCAYLGEAAAVVLASFVVAFKDATVRMEDA